MSGLPKFGHQHESETAASEGSDLFAQEVPPVAVYPENKECPSCYTCVPNQATACAYCSYDFG